MATDLQETIKALRDMVSIIDPADDYLTIVNAEEKIKAAQAKRKKELDEAHSNLKALSKVLDAAKISSTRPTTILSAEAHSEVLNDLDSSRLSLAKAISDAEGLLASKEAELTSLKEEARKLEESDPAHEHEIELDANPLRLEVYKGLGFHPVVDPKSRVLKKMIIQTLSGDMYSLERSSDLSDFEYTQKLWSLASL